MSDEHLVSSTENFFSIPEEDSGNGQVYVPQPSSGTEGLLDGQQWGLEDSDGQVVVGTRSPLLLNAAFLQQGSTPLVPSSASTFPPGGTDGVPLPRGNGPQRLRPPALAYPAPQQELPSPSTPHSPVAEEFWTERGFPGVQPVEESSGTSNDVTETETDVTADHNVIQDSNEHPDENPPINEEEDFISVKYKKLMDENRELKEWKGCLVCFDRPKEVLILPCAHVAVCSLCVQGLRKCCMCRGNIKDTVTIRLSEFIASAGRQPNANVVSLV